MGGFKTRVVATVFAAIAAIAAPFVVHFEGSVSTGYADPVGIPTICVGHTGADVRVGQKATQAECDAWLRDDLTIAYADVVRCIRVQLRPNEAAALTSFALNVGGDALCSSTLARLANAGMPALTWCAELDRWVFAQGQRLPGLVKRRATERELCEGRILEFPKSRAKARAVSNEADFRRAA
jgi:lysozyme